MYVTALRREIRAVQALLFKSFVRFKMCIRSTGQVTSSNVQISVHLVYKVLSNRTTTHGIVVTGGY